jgi:hypothetical protein
MHTASHPLADKVVRLNSKAADPARGIVTEDAVYHIIDWWDLLTGKSWGDSDGNFAAMHYGMRMGLTEGPWDDEVVYGHIGAFGHLVHVSELGDVLEGWRCDECLETIYSIDGVDTQHQSFCSLNPKNVTP